VVSSLQIFRPNVHMHATCPVLLILLDMIALIIFVLELDITFYVWPLLKFLEYRMVNFRP
jgi:hypothetical protein